jgi:four helix bundle protein
MGTGNTILDMTFSFALDIITFTEILNENKKFVIGQQLLKSGTSIGANVKEAQNSESKVDFIHKFKIAAKEADETEYWLMLCKHAKTYPFDETLLDKLRDIQKIISKIISTSKQRLT